MQPISIGCGSAKSAVGLLCVLLSMMLLQGCTQSANDDLFEYVSMVKSRKAKKIPPLPEFRTYETYKYTASDLRDPFEPSEQQAAIADGTSDSTMRPDADRNREALEAYPLDALHFVGNLEREGKTWAIVTSPDNMVHRVTEGNYIGQNYGKIVTISDDRISVTEVVQDSRGGWIERNAALTLTE